MYTNCRWLIVPALLVGFGSLVLAQDSAAERATGKVLLLKNGNAVEGDIVKVGTRMCVRRGRSEIWIDADQTTRLCANWNDAYSYLQSRLKLGSADDRLRFARWCQMNQLKDQALEQGKLAVQMEPRHREAQQFVALLERSMKEAQPAPSLPAVTPSAGAPAVHIEVSAETFASFAARVQPILMNKCAGCHVDGRFRLDRASSGGQAVAIRNNLDTVLAYLDIAKPAQSPLLVNAVAAHGGATTAPVKDRKEAPAQILQAWIEQTIASNPRVKEHYAVKKPVKVVEEVKVAADPAPKNDAPVIVSRSVPRMEITAEATPPPSVASVPSTPVKQGQAPLEYLQTMARKQPLPVPVEKIASTLIQQIEQPQVAPPSNKEIARPSQPIDPFDPVQFNQANHPYGPSWQTRPSASASR